MMTDERRRLLIVDNDQNLLSSLKEKFETDGYDVGAFLDAPDTLRYIQSFGLPHLALIDLKLPTIHGFELAEKIKNLGDVPIIFITGERDSETVIDGLTRYADDYVVKPFELGELVARVRRVLSRIVDFDYARSPLIPVDDRVAVDFGNSKLVIENRPVLLTPTEANLLHILLRNAGRVVTSDMLIARVWPGDEVYEDTLRVHMHRFRRKIEADVRHPKYIQTERGVGYRFMQVGSQSIRLMSVTSTRHRRS